MNVPDLVSLSYRQMAMLSPVAPASAFAAGVLTSVGPCVAPRYVAFAGLVSQCSRQRRFGMLVSFVSGLVLSYLMLGAFVSVVAGVAAFSTWIYAVLAVTLAITGIRALLVRGPACAHAGPTESRSYGAALLLGASSALVLSPCCTPFVTAIGSFAALQRGTALSLAVIAAFALGHALPLTALACGSRMVERLPRFLEGSGAAATIGGALSLALACYYGLLA